jgi:hypothetical protein
MRTFFPLELTRIESVPVRTEAKAAAAMTLAVDRGRGAEADRAQERRASTGYDRGPNPRLPSLLICATRSLSQRQ